MILLTRQSQATGNFNSMILDLNRGDIEKWESSGKFIQDYFPDLSDDDREFILTGVTPEEWDEIFGEEDDE